MPLNVSQVKSLGITEHTRRKSPKEMVQATIRAIHARWSMSELPSKIGIYLHSLEKDSHYAFRSMVRFFTNNGYKFVLPGEFIASDEDRLVFLSFDDNYRSWFDSLPLLYELDVPATFYVNTGVFRDTSSEDDRKSYFNRLAFEGIRETLSQGELIAIERAGHVIGAHTHTHPILTQMHPSEARSEMLRSKEVLEHLLEHEIVHFSYPFGMRRYFNEDLREYAVSIGFQYIANAIPGMQYVQQQSHAIQRSGWHLNRSIDHNIENLCIDGHIFERLTGLSAVG